MKNPITALTLFLVSAVLGCQAPRPAQEPLGDRRSSSTVGLNTSAHGEHTAVLLVKGLACPFCTYNVERQLRKVTGVKSVAVTLATGQVTVTFSKEQPPSEKQLRKAVKESGFTVDRVEMP